jgi:hypothetical protein
MIEISKSYILIKDIIYIDWARGFKEYYIFVGLKGKEAPLQLVYSGDNIEEYVREKVDEIKDWWAKEGYFND